MNNEKNTIKLISSVMPKSPLQINGLNESDAEIIDYKGNKLLFTVDDFSKEDMFRENDPYVLGYNIASASISDILATGGTPLYYLHSMCVPSKWDDKYIECFSRGIAEVLKINNTSFLGGDFSKSEEWTYTVTVIGELKGNSVLRSGAKVSDSVYITGKVGTGNLEAFLKMYENKKRLRRGINRIKLIFKNRKKEAELINKYATACIDTSDGCYNSINTIAEMSGVGYEIAKIPYIRLGAIAAKIAKIPELLLFLGECGEYELMFTVSKAKEPEFLLEAKNKGLIFYKIGKIVDSGTKSISDNRLKIDFNNINISARDYDSIEMYLEQLIHICKETGESGK